MSNPSSTAISAATFLLIEFFESFAQFLAGQDLKVSEEAGIEAVCRHFQSLSARYIVTPSFFDRVMVIPSLRILVRAARML